MMKHAYACSGNRIVVWSWTVGCVVAAAVAIGATPVAAQKQFVPDPTPPKLPDNARLCLGTLRFRAPSSVADLALSPDEKTIVSIASNHLIAWDTATGEERWRADSRMYNINLVAASYGTRAVVFSSDSDKVYTPSGDSHVIAWDVADGRSQTIELPTTSPIGNLLDNFRPRPASPRRCLDITSDASRWLLGGDGGLTVFDGDHNKLFLIPNKPEDFRLINPNMNSDRLTFGGHYTYGRFSPDGKLLAVVTSNSPDQIRLVDATTGNEVRSIALSNWLVRLAFSPDGKRIAATERDSAVRLYSVDSGEEIWSYVTQLKNNAEAYTSGVEFSPDGKLIAAGAPIGSDNWIYLLDAKSGDLLDRLEGHTWKPWALAFTKDSQLLYSAGWDGNIRRWDIPQRRQIVFPEGSWANGTTAASTDGRMLAYTDDLGTVRIVNAADGTVMRTLEVARAHYSQLIFSPDSQLLAGGGNIGDQVHVVVWRLADGQRVHEWNWDKGKDPHSDVEELRFTSDGKRLAAAVFRQSTAYIWELANELKTIELKHPDIYGLSFSPDGKTLATAGWDKVIRFWDAETGAPGREFNLAEVLPNEGDIRMYTVSYAPQGNQLATAHLDGIVRIWDPGSMQLLNQFQVEGRFVYGSIAYSLDGMWLATGAANGDVSVWDPLTGDIMWNPGRHQHYVYTLAFGPDPTTLLSGGTDGVCYLWHLPTEIAADDDLQPYWNDLEGGDNRAAYRAMSVLTKHPQGAVTLLARNVRPSRQTVDQIQQWIADLDSPDEARRQAAEQALNKAGSVAVSQLTQAVDAAETPFRAQLLRDALESAQAEAQLERRAVSLLGKIDSPQARLLLKGWASRDRQSVLGQHAAALVGEDQ